MTANGGVVNESPVRRTRRLSRTDDGIGMVEIMVAFVVFMICFIPLMQMLPSGEKIITYSADQRLAAAVANTTLENDQNSVVAANDQDFTTVRTWAAAPRTSTQQGGVTFQIFTVGGWCATDTTPGNAASGVLSTQQPSYHIVVKVGWGAKVNANSTDHVVVDSTELSTVAKAPAVGVPVVSCPLGLT